MAVRYPRPILAAACAVLAACARQPEAAPSPTPTAVPVTPATARPAPARTAAPAPRRRRRSAPLAALTPAPAVTATPPAVVYLGPNAAPRIIAMSMEPPRVRAGDTLNGTVTASSNTASVEVRIGGYGVTMQKIGVGRFALRYPVPNVPFLHGTFTAQVIARNAAGASVRKELPIEIY